MPNRVPKAIVNPLVLQWLRTSAGLSEDETARRLQTKTENIAAWENGEKQPSMSQLRRLAQAFRRTISDFYLPKPMPEPPIPHDFRRISADGTHVYSPALRHELRLAYRRRVVALDLAAELEVVPKKFELLASISIRDDPESVGNSIRRILGVDLAQQQHWREPRKGYNTWRSRIEDLDVLVFQVTSVDRKQMLGFSFAFEQLPVIAINRKNRPNGRAFTLLHEFTHLLLKEGGICDFEEEAVRPQQEQQVEVFCNHVAGAALVPMQELLTHAVVRAAGDRHPAWTDESLNTLAHDFCSSEEVILRRLLIGGRITKEFYAAKRKQLAARFAELEKAERDQLGDDFKRNMPLEAASNLGYFARLVMNSYNADAINLTDASKFLGVKAEKVSAVGEYLG